MSKASSYSSPKAMSRPGSPGPALGAGYDKNEDREALMMGPVGERRNGGDKIDKVMDQAAPAAKDQSEFTPSLFWLGKIRDWADGSSPYSQLLPRIYHDDCRQ
jgi:hypothetical protein